MDGAKQVPEKNNNLSAGDALRVQGNTCVSHTS